MMKKIIKPLFIAIILIAFSCTNTEKNQQEANMKLVEQLFIHFNNHNWKGMASMYINSAEFKDPSFGNKTVIQTQDEIVQKYAELEQIFPNIKDSVVHVYPSGKNIVIVEFISTGDSKDGYKMSLPICSIITIKNGKFIKDYNYYDNF